MFREAEDSVVIELAIDLVVSQRAAGVAAGGEGTGDLKLGIEGVRGLVHAVKLDAEAGFVHEFRGECGDIGEMQVVVVGLAVIRSFGERGAASTHVFLMLVPRTEAGHESVFRAELPVHFGQTYPETLRSGDVLENWGLVTRRIDADGIDGSEVVDGAVFEIEDEIGALLTDWAGEFKPIALLPDGGAADREGVAGIHPGTGVGGEDRSMEGGLTGLGIDLDLAAVEGWIPVLRGEQIGVDLDVTDRGFRRESAVVVTTLKAVDGQGRVRWVATSSSGHLLKLAEEIVGVVGEGLEALAREGLAWTTTGGRVGGSGIVVAITDLDGCLDYFGLERDGEIGCMGSADGEAQSGEASEGNVQRVTPRRGTSYVEPARSIAKDGCGRIELNGGSGNYGLRRVTHNARKRRAAGLGGGCGKGKEDKRGCKARKAKASAIRCELSVGAPIRGL